jgi:hypothetical protein
MRHVCVDRLRVKEKANGIAMQAVGRKTREEV